MNRYIIGYSSYVIGRSYGHPRTEEIEAPSLRAAYAEAVRRTMANGYAHDDPSDLDDTFAKEWTEDWAREFNLLPPTQEQAMADYLEEMQRS